MWDVVYVTLAMASIIICNVNGQYPNSVYCEECTRCTNETFHGHAYSCQGDTTFQPVCDCSTCGCTRGTENWCEIEIALGAFTMLFINFKDDENTKKTTIYGTPLLNTLLEKYGPRGPRSTLWQTTLDGNLYCNRAEIKPSVCQDFIAVSTEIEGLIREVKTDISFFNELIAALGSDDENEALKNKLTPALNFFFIDIKKLLEYSLDHCEQIAQKEVGLECVTDNMCSHPLKMCDKSDCTCHQCKENIDCRHQKHRKFCRANTQNIMVCGDPHVSQSIKGLEENLCYDFLGQPGQSYLFLQENGLEVSSKFISTDGDSHTPGALTEYVDEVTIKQDGARIVITPKLITATEPNRPVLILDWRAGNKKRTRMTGLGQLELTAKQCILNLKHGKSLVNGEMTYDGELNIIIMRKGMARGKPFLNFGINDSKGLPPDAKGIMGSLSNEVMFSTWTTKQSAQASLTDTQNYQHNIDSIIERYNQHNNARNNQHNAGTIKWSGRTFKVHKDKKSCWKIAKESLDEFNSMLEKFIVHEDS